MRLSDVLLQLRGVHAMPGYWIALCPAHDDRHPSLSIREGENGRLLLKCFAGCSYETIKASLNVSASHPALAIKCSASQPNNDCQEEHALRIWRDSKPAPGTLVEKYLRSRGITALIPSTLRFHPSLKHPSGKFTAAMVAAVQNPGGRIVAIHRTFLKPDGSGKADLEPQKMTLGTLRGGAVRLSSVCGLVALAEGVETAMSVLQATGIPTWGTLGTANLCKIKLPEHVREVIICSDRDEAGERAAYQTAARLLREGLRVKIARPSSAKDFNDLRR